MHDLNLKPLFEILPAGVEAEQSILVCEISKDCFIYTIKDINKNMCMAMAMYSFDPIASVDTNSYALDAFLQKQLTFASAFKKVCVVYSYDESVMIPFNLYNSAENDDVLNLIYGDIENNNITLTDLITENESYNTYRVPASVLKVMSIHFPNAETAHQYSVLLRKMKAEEGNKLLLIFYSQKIVVVLKNNSLVQFINTIYYNTPEDVSYALLNICAQYNASDVSVEVYGFVEKESALFREIYKYFESVAFATLPLDYNYKEEILQHPHHFFSHLFAINSCE